jgi:MbtH-like protein
MAQQPQSRGKLVAPSYQVVVNNKEQYTIWPDGLELPVGWCEVGVSGAGRSAWLTSKGPGPARLILMKRRADVSHHDEV